MVFPKGYTWPMKKIFSKTFSGALCVFQAHVKISGKSWQSMHLFHTYFIKIVLEYELGKKNAKSKYQKTRFISLALNVLNNRGNSWFKNIVKKFGAITFLFISNFARQMDDPNVIVRDVYTVRQTYLENVVRAIQATIKCLLFYNSQTIIINVHKM